MLYAVRNTFNLFVKSSRTLCVTLNIAFEYYTGDLTIFNQEIKGKKLLKIIIHLNVMVETNIIWSECVSFLFI